MNRFIAMFVAVCHFGLLSAPLLFAQNLEPPVKQAPPISLYSFPGIFTDYRTAVGGPVYNTSLRPLASQLTDVNTRIGADQTQRRNGFAATHGSYAAQVPNPGQVLLAHSMGGVRALAYAMQASRRGDIRGVITLNAPVKGHSALDLNVSHMRERLVDSTWPILEGIYLNREAIKAAFPSALIAVAAITKESILPLVNIVNQIEKVVVSKDLVFGEPLLDKQAFSERLSDGQVLSLKLLRPLFSSLGIAYEHERDLAGLFEFIGGIRDLAPDSPFMNDYINSQPTVKRSESRMVRTLIRTDQTARVVYKTHSFWGVSWQTPSHVEYINTPVYSYAYIKPRYLTTHQPQQPGTQPRLSANTRVGFVTGLNTSLTKAAADNGWDNPNADPDLIIKLSSEVLGYIALTLSVLGGSTLVWSPLLLMVPYIGIVLFVAAIVSAFLLLTRGAQLSSAARSIQRLVPNILLTSSHDGLIPLSDQSRPIGPNGLGGRSFGIGEKVVHEFDNTHMGVRNDPRLFGQSAPGGASGSFQDFHSEIHPWYWDTQGQRWQPLLRRWVDVNVQESLDSYVTWANQQIAELNPRRLSAGLAPIAPYSKTGGTEDNPNVTMPGFGQSEVWRGTGGFIVK